MQQLLEQSLLRLQSARHVQAEPLHAQAVGLRSPDVSGQQSASERQAVEDGSVM